MMILKKKSQICPIDCDGRSQFQIRLDETHPLIQQTSAEPIRISSDHNRVRHQNGQSQA